MKKLVGFLVGVVIGFLSVFPIALVLGVIDKMWGKNASLIAIALIVILLAPDVITWIRKITGQSPIKKLSREEVLPR